ncbi:aminotransferase class I/II-fold pyridoxal phosphate-dependent enzyme [Subtercola frigoramans]|uniref:Histidinol-phosphate aminotransferase n=1 Tax=Subtercola frigoramans TaxID=120298 RepID=A0ABS2L0W6_9MICO|nr:aminotransferase class I/II-fold pyridoxal phosphate-dependent enzyme [Subtercola frigoramans]MBM7470714.1 histidinol-phosphate aminotransferase [Subtercola frigoramans]
MTGPTSGWSARTLSAQLPAPRAALAAIPAYSSAPASAVPVSIRASSNEAPDGVSSLVKAAVLARLETANRYPLLGATEVARAIADHLGADESEVAVADGSLSLLNYLLLAYCTPGSTVVAAWRSYEAYPICIRTAGAEPVLVPNTPDGGHDLDAMAAAVNASTAAVIVCTPNNPTGVALTHTAIIRFLAQVPPRVLVVLDEAYLDFDDSADPPRSRELLAAHANLAVLRTFSKAYGLAGLRMGYVVAHPKVIGSLRKVLPPFPVSALTAAAAVAAIGDQAYREAIVCAVIDQRAALVRMLDQRGVAHTDSRSNFVWLPLGDASQTLGALCAERGMSTRVFAGEGIRVSLGEPGLLEAFTDAIDALLGDVTAA